MSNKKETVGIKFTLRGKYDSNQTFTFWLTSQALLDEKPFPDGPAFPILQGISDVGVEQNEFFPKFQSGNVILNNGTSTTAFERRLTDLAAVYVFQNATADIYIICTDHKDGEFFSHIGNPIWQGQVSNVNYSTRGQDSTQRLNIAISRVQEEHLVTKKLRPSEFPTMPDRSVNKFLPVVLGFAQQVIPYPIDEPISFLPLEATFSQMAYATNFEGGGNQFRNTGIQRILAPDLNVEANIDSKYEQVLSAPIVNAAVYNEVAPAIGFAPTIDNVQAFWLPYFPGTIVSSSYIVTSIRLFAQGNGVGGAATGEITIKLHRQRKDEQRPKEPSEALASASISKEDYSALINSAPGVTFAMEAVFNRPVPIVGDGTYWISVQGANETGSSVVNLELTNSSPAVPGLVTHYTTTDTVTENNKDAWLPVGTTSIRYELFGIQFNDVPQGDGSFDVDGLGYSFTDVRYMSFSLSHPQGQQQVDDISRIDLILEIDGLTDVTGNITGVPGFILGNPATQTEALFHTFDGADWNPGPFDKTRFAATHIQYIDVLDRFFRETAGRTFGKTNNIELIEDICRNSYSTVVYDGVAGSNYSLLAVGQSRPAVATIDDKTALIQRWFVNDLSNVVNALDMNYARRLDNIHFQTDKDQQDLEDYSKTLLTHHRDGGTGQLYGAVSYAHYGEKRLQNENFDFINSDQSALSVSELYFRLHDHPYEYVQMVVPYCTFSQLKLYDIVKIHSTELPSVYGTAPEAYLCNEDCWLNGPPWAKLQPYLGEIVALTINFQARGPIQMRLLCRLLTQQNDPILEFG